MGDALSRGRWLGSGGGKTRGSGHAAVSPAVSPAALVAPSKRSASTPPSPPLLCSRWEHQEELRDFLREQRRKRWGRQRWWHPGSAAYAEIRGGGHVMCGLRGQHGVVCGAHERGEAAKDQASICSFFFFCFSTSEPFASSLR